MPSRRGFPVHASRGRGDQVSRYWERYRLVLVTNTHDRRNIVTSRFDRASL